MCYLYTLPASVRVSTEVAKKKPKVCNKTKNNDAENDDTYDVCMHTEDTGTL